VLMLEQKLKQLSNKPVCRAITRLLCPILYLSAFAHTMPRPE
jgi:hypothetical protein